MERALIFVLGLAIGSFLNVIIDRVADGESILWGRSHCDSCRKPLRWFELIPVVSFIIQRGRCVRCKTRLSYQYPLVECLTAVVFVALYIAAPVSFETPATALLFGSALLIAASSIVILVADIKYQLIPDSAVWGLAVASVLRLYVSPALIVNAVMTCGIAGSIFLLLWWITRGRGMGFGDVKLATVLGLLLGYPYIVIALYIAFLTGALTGVILIVERRAKMKSKIAFGPFLIIGGVISLLWGSYIVTWWIHLL